MRHPSTAILIVLSLLTIIPAGTAHSQEWLWSTAGNGIDHDSGDRIAVDSLGYVYMLGRYSGRIDFGTTPLYGTGMWDTFIAKYNPAGVLQWATSITGTGNDLPGDIAVDRAGNVYVTGSFERSTSVNGRVVQSRGGTDIFLAKLDYLGRVIWAETAGGTGYDYSRGIALDEAAQHVFITGSFEGRAYFGADTVNSRGSSDVIIARFVAANGGVTWTRAGGGPNFEEGFGIGVDLFGNSYVVGTFADTARFYDHHIALAGSDSGALFLIKVDFAGIPRTGVPITHYPRSRGRVGLAVDQDGNSYIAGSFVDSIKFGQTWVQADSGRDAFLVRYNPFGGFRWAATYGDSLNDDGIGAGVDASGGAYLTGSFNNTGDLTLDTGHTERMFVAKYLGTTGALVWSRESEGNLRQRGLDVAPDRLGNTYVSGLFTGAAFFGDEQETGGTVFSDMFLVKIGTAAAIETGTITGTPLCAGTTIRVPYTTTGTFYGNNVFRVQLSDTGGSFDAPLIIGQRTATGPGTIDASLPAGLPGSTRYRIRVVGTAPAVMGTDNGVDVEIIPVPRPIIVQEGPDTICAGASVTLDAGADYQAYRWSNGATTRTITVSQTGRYWVDVTTVGSCGGRSDTVQILVAPIPEKPVITQVGNQLLTKELFNHQWYLNGEPIPGANRERFLPAVSGLYTVRVWNEYGCDALSEPYNYRSLSVRSDERIDDLSVRHDREAGEVLVESGRSTALTVQLVDAAGRVLAVGSSAGGRVPQRVVLDVGGIAQGVYLVRVIAGTRSWTEKLRMP